MKKIFLILIFLLLIVAMTACSLNETVTDSRNNAEVDDITAEGIEDTDTAEASVADDIPEDIREEDIITVGGTSAMYISTDVKRIYIYSDLAVRARYVKDIDTYAKEGSGMPITVAGFEVVEVLKGEYNDDVIDAKYCGGIVPMSEYLQALSESTLKKTGYDGYTEKEIESKFVKFIESDPAVELTVGEEYLLLLEYIPESGVYNILCDGYGARVIEDNKVYNIIKDEYVAMSEIKAINETELKSALDTE
ncbi:MAG: hypothetical protein IJA55_08925 [Clostridia bacterium]|nr:hypothetical protein [Clostridia bacterium]